MKTETITQPKVTVKFAAPKLARHQFLKENLALILPFLAVGFVALFLITIELMAGNHSVTFGTGIIIFVIACLGLSINFNKLKNIKANQAHAIRYTPNRYNVYLYWETLDTQTKVTEYIQTLLNEYNVYEKNRYGASSNLVCSTLYNAVKFSDKTPKSNSSFFIEDTNSRLEIEVTYQPGQITVTSYLS
jgi:hypothetical protein